jgi:hypothetical protein
MKILNYRVLLSLALMLNSLHSVLAKDQDVELSKRYSLAYKVSPGAQIDLVNKYGDIIVKTWNKDSVRFDIRITAYGKNDDAVERLIERVSFDHTNSGKFLKFSTVFDRQSGSFKEFWNSLGDYSKVLINKNNLHIDYEVYLPKSANLYLENKFGDIYINEFYGRCKVNLSQGDMKAGRISGTFNLELKFGNGSLQDIQSGFFKLQIADVQINKAQRLDINSSSSSVRIGEVNQLKIDSRNDKYRLKSVKTLNGETTFSNILISNLASEMIGNSDFSDLVIEDFTESGKMINLNGKSTDINIWLRSTEPYDVDVIAKEDKLQLPVDWENLRSYYTDDRERYKRYSGQTGSGDSARIIIDNQGGSLNIYEK